MDQTGSMPFGQASGPPATTKQVQQLLTLLQAAGHADFRDARGPMGFTQRQAAGRMTRDEADAFIDQLEADAEDRAAPFVTPSTGRPSAAQHALGRLPSEQLAAELQRRGWLVIEPSSPTDAT
jgi:hypothetical protein